MIWWAILMTLNSHADEQRRPMVEYWLNDTGKTYKAFWDKKTELDDGSYLLRTCLLDEDVCRPKKICKCANVFEVQEMIMREVKFK